jgi:hypothetical protein
VTALDETSRLRRRSDTIASRFEDGAVILSFGSETYYGLNPVGSRVWELLDRERSVEEIVDRLVTEFDVERDVCTRDVEELLQQLISNDLVDVLDPS